MHYPPPPPPPSIGWERAASQVIRCQLTVVKSTRAILLSPLLLPPLSQCVFLSVCQLDVVEEIISVTYYSRSRLASRRKLTSPTKWFGRFNWMTHCCFYRCEDQGEETEEEVETEHCDGSKNSLLIKWIKLHAIIIRWNNL